MLAKNSKLRIVSRTSAMQYKHVEGLLREVARRLGVDAILEGSVERENGRVHMTVQLIDARKDSHIWAETFDRDQVESVSLTGEVAQAVAKRLGCALSPARRTRAVLAEAHDAYLHGRYLWFTDHEKDAGAQFEKAVKLQPDYALAWTGLADNYTLSAVEGEMSPGDSIPLGKAAALRALSLETRLPRHISASAPTSILAIGTGSRR